MKIKVFFECEQEIYGKLNFLSNQAEKNFAELITLWIENEVAKLSNDEFTLMNKLASINELAGSLHYYAYGEKAKTIEEMNEAIGEAIKAEWLSNEKYNRENP